jgi:hypothetical protein
MGLLVLTESTRSQCGMSVFRRRMTCETARGWARPSNHGLGQWCEARSCCFSMILSRAVRALNWSIEQFTHFPTGSARMTHRPTHPPV